MLRCGRSRACTGVRIAVPGAALVAILASLSPVPARASDADVPDRKAPEETLIIDPDGGVRSWTPGQDLLRVASLGEVEAVNDLASAGVGRWLLLPVPGTPSRPGGAGRSDRQGEAVVITLPSSTPGVPPLHLTFPGEGLKGVVSTDGTAYVLAREGGGTRREGATGQTWIHRLDLEKARVIGSTAIDQPGTALAIDPDGRRLYLAVEGRIRSFTTKPLAASWHYRSPGINRVVTVRPESHILYVARGHEVAVFDPDADLMSGDGDRPDRPDDATGVIGLSSEPGELRFSADGRLLLAIGMNREVEVIDVDRQVVIPVEPPAVVQTAAAVRPIVLMPGGPAVVACFPAGVVIAIDLPTTEPVPAAVVVPAVTIPAQSKIARPQPEIIAPPGETAAPQVETPAPPSGIAAPPPAPDAVPPGGVLVSGSVLGAFGRVEAVVIYGPGSIVREAARVPPGADGRWTITLTRPGIYRVVPVGPGSSPVGATPGFQTVKTETPGKPGAVISGVDFTIPAGR